MAKQDNVEKQEEKKALSDYERMFAAVRCMKTMTDTEAWQAFVRKLHTDIKAHAEEVLDAEKPREVIQHQVGVKLLRRMLDYPAEPVKALQCFVTAQPLFAVNMTVRAAYNRQIGTIELSEAK